MITGYKPGPGGNDFYAKLRLLNDTTNVIKYTPVFIYSELTSTGWTSAQWEAKSQGQTFEMGELLPGRSVELTAPLTPGGLPKKIAVLTENLPPVGRSAFSDKARRWASPVFGRLNIKIATPELLDLEEQRIWCDEVIDQSKLERR